ncbi:MAG: hypothetical protein ACREIP_18180 [Alphaproteobacteria bacterium]
MMAARSSIKIGAVVLAVGITLVAARVYRVEMAQRFSSGRWKAEGGQTLESAARYDMAEELRSHLAPGMPRSDVVDILGPPDWETKDRIAYKLGIPDGIDYYTLEIRFDAAQRLRDTALVQS